MHDAFMIRTVAEAAGMAQFVDRLFSSALKK
jgi:hypothetical protein